MEAFWKPSEPHAPICLTQDASRVVGGQRRRAPGVVPLA
jgi:hypothetical protein